MVTVREARESCEQAAETSVLRGICPVDATRERPSIKLPRGNRGARRGRAKHHGERARTLHVEGERELVAMPRRLRPRADARHGGPGAPRQTQDLRDPRGRDSVGWALARMVAAAVPDP